MRVVLKRFVSDEKGATAIEYAFLAAILAVGIVPAVSTVEPAISAILVSVVGWL